MKTIGISTLAIFVTLLTLGISSCSGGGQGQQDHAGHQDRSTTDMEAGAVQLTEFRVNGNCGMCKQRIEEAAKTVNGVNSAEWSAQAQMVKIEMDQGTDLHEVHMAIAGAGHDTEMHRASDEAYESLHTCCLYERE